MKLRAMLYALVASAVAVLAVSAQAAARPFLDRLGSIHTVSSMVPASGPAKGDVNPYGVAVVQASTGKLVKGDVLVSNFNDAKNEQGTGSSIIEVSPSGRARVFAVVPKPPGSPAVGLTTALVELRGGFVIVGNLPAPGGKSSAAKAGALTVLNSAGDVVETIRAGDIDGPWDMTAVDHGTTASLFVTNVLNGTVAANGKIVRHGTVVRLDLSVMPGAMPMVMANTVIGTGFAEHTDPNALVVGPTGVGMAPSGTLYVADSNNNRVAAIPKATMRMNAIGGGGKTVSKGGALDDPLGLTITPGGDVLTANGGDGKFVETSPHGRQVAVKQLIPNGGGDLFGLEIAPKRHGVYFVDDAGSGAGANSLRLLF
jgi:hypothetical protein